MLIKYYLNCFKLTFRRLGRSEGSCLEVKRSGIRHKLNEIDIATKKINSITGFKAVLKTLAEEM